MGTELTKCPSCGGEIQPLKNGRWFCEACDAIFRISREGPVLEKLAPIEELRQRVDRLEQRSGTPDPESPAAIPDTASAGDPDDDEGDDNDDDVDKEVAELWQP